VFLLDASDELRHLCFIGVIDAQRAGDAAARFSELGRLLDRLRAAREIERVTSTSAALPLRPRAAPGAPDSGSGFGE
jgi:hypothetical protein